MIKKLIQAKTLRIVLCLLLTATFLPVNGQSAERDLERINEKLISYFREKKPEWVHETTTPLAAPGSKPSSTVAIHFWAGKKCLAIEATIDGVERDDLPLPCKVKVSVLQAASPEKAEAEMKEFIGHEQLRKWKPIPLILGDEGYVWARSNVVFRKGRYKFYLSSFVNTYSYQVDSFEIEQEVTVAFAKDVAQAVSVK